MVRKPIVFEFLQSNEVTNSYLVQRSVSYLLVTYP